MHLSVTPDIVKPADLHLWSRTRLRLAAKLARWSRWEFWPALAVYAPLTPWFAWLAYQHGVTTAVACNTSLPMSVIIGESKWAILRQLDQAWTVPGALIEPGPMTSRLQALQQAVMAGNWSWPIILKPDVGERGAGVRLIRSMTDAEEYFKRSPQPIVAQAYDPGPEEAGIFYIRMPHWRRGRIYSITSKQFPIIKGDGVSTLESLILRHPRYRLQADIFMARLGARSRSVPARDERVRLAMAGNHCQGTMFLDGQHLITHELTMAIDAIAKQTPGFYFGRFDVRYRSDAELRQGTGFRIVELNGLLSESTNMYDPSFSFRRGLRVLLRQWAYACRIGQANAAAGTHVPSVMEVWRAIGAARALRRADALAD